MPTLLHARETTETVGVGNTLRRVRDVSNTIQYLDPSENPFTLLSKAASTRSVSNSKYEWMEKDAPAKVTQATDTSSTAPQPVTGGHGNRFSPGDIMLNVRTGEISTITSIATDTLTTVRGVGTVAATANVVGDDLIIIGTAFAEGAALSQERSTLEAFLFNYTQIFRHPFGTTGTEMVSENYGGKDKPRLRKEAAVEHMKDIERAFIYGNRFLSASTSAPVRTTGGFLYFVTTNIQDAGGTLTEPEMETFTQTVFTATASGNERTVFAAPGVLSVLDQLAAGRLQVVPSTTTYGIGVKQWMTSHGTLNIVKHRLLANGPGGTGYGGYALAVDTKKIAYAKLNQRDTKLREDVGTPGDDGWTDEYLTECGFEVHNQTAHGILKAVTS